MNANQKQFYDYVMPLAQEGKENELRALVEENFRHQDDGTITKEYMLENGPKLISLLKPEAQEQFQKNMAHFMGTI